jgi:hypothetical protein
VVDSSDDTPRKVSDLTGVVTRGSLGKGSKSEQDAVWIETPEGRFVLRRKGGPSFGDRSLDKYVGKRVKCAGFIVGHSLLAEDVEVSR